MATSKKNVTKRSAPGLQLTNYNLVIRSVQRATADIAKWRNAHRAAENSPLETRIDLYDLFDDVLLDPHLSSIINKRLMAVTNVKLRFVKDGKDVEELQRILKSSAFKRLLREILNARMWGISLIENTFTPEYDIWSVPRKHIRPNKGVIAYEQFTDSGFSYREGMFLNTMVEVCGEDVYGILLRAVPWVLYKRGCMGDWAQFTEVFGMPTRVGRYSGYDEATRLQLEAALDQAGSALSIVIPEEAKLELMAAQVTTGSSDLYMNLLNTCDEQLSILVLGQTETTKSSKSSGYAQSKTHARTEDDINQDDREFVLSVLDTAVRHVFTQAGLPMDGGEWMFQDAEEQLTLKDRVEIDTTLRSAGLPIDDDYFYEKYNIPKPADYAKQKKAAPKKEKPAVEMGMSEDLLQKMRDFFG